MSKELSLRQVPDRLASRRRAWFLYFHLFNALHYLLGIVAVLAGLAITLIPGYNHVLLVRVLGAAAAFSAGLLTVLKPENGAREYIRAWRVLDEACTRYELLENYSLEKVIDAERDGEKLLEASSEKNWY